MDNFDTVFTFYDLVDPSPAYFIITIAGAILLLGALTSCAVRFCSKDFSQETFVEKGNERWVPHILLLTIGGLLVVLAQSMIVVPKDLDHIYQNNLFEVTEGTVHVLHAQLAEGHHAGDIIQINGQKFHLSYYEAKPHIYNLPISHGGILTEGAYVRLY